MRFLHTSDWHVGRTIRGRSRLDEFEAVLGQIAEIAREEAVDAVLVAGDLFDHPVPTAEAEQLLYATLLEIRATGAQVVAINGNHESEQRLEAVSPLLAGNGITLRTGLLSPAAGGIVTVPSRDGSETASVACIPFIPPRKVGDARALFENLASWPEAYAEQCAALLAGYAAAIPAGTVPILMAHLFASGAKLGGGEREVSVGPDYAISASALPATVAYVALGHIHRRQRVTAAPAPAWYSGSPLMLDFGEERDRKSVTIVEAVAGRPASVREVELSAGRALVTIGGTLEQVLVRGAEMPDAYLRIRVDLPGPRPHLADEVRAALPNAVDVTVRYPDAVEETRPSLETLGPRERFERYLREKGYTDVEPHIATFDELLEAEQGAVL